MLLKFCCCGLQGFSAAGGRVLGAAPLVGFCSRHYVGPQLLHPHGISRVATAASHGWADGVFVRVSKASLRSCVAEFVRIQELCVFGASRAHIPRVHRWVAVVHIQGLHSTNTTAVS